MLYRVCGRSGSGKTEYIMSVLEDVYGSGGECVIIVPEQQSLEYERRICDRFGSGINMKCEVLNFERLPNRTYREYGGLAASYIDDGGRDIIMSIVLEDIRDKLLEYKNVYNDSDFIKQMISSVNMLKSNGIGPEMLGAAAKVVEGKRIRAKLLDMENIINEYNRYFNVELEDSFDALSAYAENLKNMPYFKNKTVIIDSFYGFSETEHRIIDAISAQGADIFVSILFDGSDSSGIFETGRDTYKRLGRNKTATDIFLFDNKRTEKSGLKTIEKFLWQSSAAPIPGASGGVSIIECESLFEEAEAAAMVILNLVRAESCRFRDILLVMRSKDDYEGIIDAVFEKHGIPLFFSVKDNLMLKPLIIFFLSSIEAAATGFSLSSMKKYIKSGFTGLKKRQADLLLKYAETWNIRGGMWTTQKEWTMNPDGYAERLTPRGEYILSEVNTAREIIMPQLSVLADSLNTKETTAGSAAKALYRHLTEAGTDTIVRMKAGVLRSSGDEAGAQKLVQLWDVIINILDQLYLICPEKKVDTKRLYHLVKMMCEEYRVGAIPPSADAVTAGVAGMVRMDNPKYTLIIGANDGMFPASAEVSGLFNDDELALLEEQGINAGNDTNSLVSREKLYFYTSAVSPVEGLYVIHSSCRPYRPSLGVLGIRTILPDIKASKYGEKDTDYLFSSQAAKENYFKIKDESLKRALKARGLDYTDIVREHPVSDKNAHINFINNGALRLSPTRLEKYTYCGFSYFGKYVLKLRENKKAEFSPLEIGSFIHRVLEKSVSACVVNGNFIMPSDVEIKKSVEEITGEYLLDVCGGLEDKDKKFIYLLEKLKKTVFILVKSVCRELEGSGFIPNGFEVDLNEKGTTEYINENGLKVFLNGKVDRVDVYETEGKKYIRVVDYKTGNKNFDKKSVENGLDLQMFIYLFALCSENPDTYPAGVVYMPAYIKPLGENEPDPAGLEEDILNSIKRTGLILADHKIASEMGGYMPFSFNKDGSFSSNSSIATLEQFGKLETQIESYIKKIALRLVEGNMDVSPLKIKGRNICTYCEMKAVCRLSTETSLARNENEYKIDFTVGGVT